MSGPTITAAPAAAGVALGLGVALALLAVSGAAPSEARADPAAAALDAAAKHTTPAAAAQHDARELHAGRFGTVQVYVPTGAPASAAIFVSGDGGWELGVINMARALRAMGALVIGVDVRQYFASLGRAAQGAEAHCQMIAADFESLSHQVQKQIGLREYHVPVLVGYSSGATVVYAA
ncbi:MAG TPA: AcvB/VirJ family lysyl-phosphatidylglycerol hydrolase, partial [Steroidobacteraceae bacterium]